jgi:ABC-2 type transport system permease protein
MKYAGLVARREYLETIKTRGFWVGVFMFPLILFLMMSVPVWLAQKATPVRYYVLVDQSGTFAPVVDSGLEKYYQKKVLDALNEYARKNATAAVNGPNSLAQFSAGNPQSLDKFTELGGQDYFLKELQPRLKSNAPPFQAPTRMYQPVPLPAELKTDADLPALARDLRPYLRGEKMLDFEGRAQSLTAAILIPSNIEQRIVRPNAKSTAVGAETNGIEYWSANVTDSDLRDQVSQAVNNEVRRKEFLARGMDAAAFHDVEQTYAPLISLNPKKEAGKETVSSGDVVQQWLPSAFVYLLWVALFGISQMLLSNTIEEKSNRIIEVLLSSVTPGELMMGKLFGIAGVGLTMIGAWALSLFFVLSAKAGASEIAGQILPILKTSHLLPMFSLYFLLGYLMYGALILSIGSVCNTLKEAQSYMSTITLIMMVPLMTMTYIPKDPNGTLARLLSWIPLFTPFTMMNRAMADPPWIDLVGTLVLLVVSAAITLWMAGKVFRIGILRTGQPPRIIEMLKWIRGGGS